MGRKSSPSPGPAKKRGRATATAVEASATASAGALDLLVKQFSQPLAFLRELVQNSLDAQTNRIDIEVVYSAEDKLNRITVHDTGEGMNREIIDQKLTRLFASGKENDLTKVGKFGIGFVSVFAIQPEAVLVDTGRDGESWRLVFHPDRSFDRIRLQEQVEGCHVTLYLKPAKESLPDLVKRCRETVQYWCKHCRTDIYLNDSKINEPFQFSTGFQVSHELPGSRMVVQAVPQEKPFYGFYNQGLTLLEGLGSPLPRMAFKLDSRYLEHTLTRDNIIHDEHYNKALEALSEVIEKKFPDELARHLSQSPLPEHWQACALTIPRSGLLQRAKIWPTLNGTRVDCRALDPQGLYSLESTRLSQAVLALPKPPPILQGDSDSPWWDAAQAAKLNVVPLHWVYCLAEEVPVDDAQGKLLAQCSRVLASGWTGGKLWPGRWLSRHPSETPCLASRYPAPGVAQLVLSQDHGKLMIDVDHPSWEKLSAIAAHDLSLAVALLAQRVVLELGLARNDALLSGLMAKGLRLRP